MGLWRGASGSMQTPNPLDRCRVGKAMRAYRGVEADPCGLPWFADSFDFCGLLPSGSSLKT
jgi:hypothetical protein